MCLSGVATLDRAWRGGSGASHRGGEELERKGWKGRSTTTGCRYRASIHAQSDVAHALMGPMDIDTGCGHGHGAQETGEARRIHFRMNASVFGSDVFCSPREQGHGLEQDRPAPVVNVSPPAALSSSSSSAAALSSSSNPRPQAAASLAPASPLAANVSSDRNEGAHRESEGSEEAQDAGIPSLIRDVLEGSGVQASEASR